MKLSEAIEVLSNHNIWRKGDDENATMTNPKKLGIAIDTLISEFEKRNTNMFKQIHLENSFTEEQMEKAWTDGAKCGKYRGRIFDIKKYI
jgi:hypothetical protein